MLSYHYPPFFCTLASNRWFKYRTTRLSAFQCGSECLSLNRLRSFTAKAIFGRVAPDKYKRDPISSWYGGTLPTWEFSSVHIVTDSFWFTSLGVCADLQFVMPNLSKIWTMKWQDDAFPISFIMKLACNISLNFSKSLSFYTFFLEQLSHKSSNMCT